MKNKIMIAITTILGMTSLVGCGESGCDHNYVKKYDEHGHWEVCEHCEDATEKVPHALVLKHDETAHWEECECGYATTKISHDLIYKHDDTNHWSECACGYTSGKEAHSYTMRFDSEGHWEQCTCGDKKEKESHVFDQKIVDEDHLASAATCTGKATYYYSCECGAIGTTTFEDGQPLGHNYDYKGNCTHDGCTSCVRIAGTYSDDGTLINTITKTGLTVYEINANSSLCIQYIENKSGSNFTHKIYTEAGTAITASKFLLSKHQKIYVHIDCTTLSGIPYFYLMCNHAYDEYGICEYCGTDKAKPIDLNGSVGLGLFTSGQSILTYTRPSTSSDTYGQLIFCEYNNEANVFDSGIALTVYDMTNEETVTVYSNNRFELKAGIDYRFVASFTFTSSTSVKAKLVEIEAPAAAKDGIFMIEDIFTVTGRGIVLQGTVLSGVINKGTPLYIYDVNKGFNDSFSVIVTGIERFKKQYDSAEAGEVTGLLIRTDKEMSDFSVNNICTTKQLTSDDIASSIYFSSYFYAKEEGGRHTPCLDSYSPYLVYSIQIDGVAYRDVNFGQMYLDFDEDLAMPGTFATGVISNSGDKATIKWLPVDLLNSISSKVTIKESANAIADIYLSIDTFSPLAPTYVGRIYTYQKVFREGYFTTVNGKYSSLLNLYKNVSFSDVRTLITASYYAEINDTVSFDEDNMIAVFEIGYTLKAAGYELTVPTDSAKTYVCIDMTGSFDFENSVSITNIETSSNKTYITVSGVNDVMFELGNLVSIYVF